MSWLAWERWWFVSWLFVRVRIVGTVDFLASIVVKDVVDEFECVGKFGNGATHHSSASVGDVGYRVYLFVVGGNVGESELK